MDPRDELPETPGYIGVGIDGRPLYECAYDGTTARLEDERCAACGRTVEEAIADAAAW